LQVKKAYKNVTGSVSVLVTTKQRINDAINIDKISEIPMDYYETIGVPITFINKYNPEQFEIISSNDIRNQEPVPIKKYGLIKDKEGSIVGKNKYVRIVIKQKDVNK